MTEPATPPRRIWYLAIAVILLGLAVPVARWIAAKTGEPATTPRHGDLPISDSPDTLIDWTVQPPPAPPLQPPDYVVSACGVCHLVPPPDIFPRELWAYQVERMFGFAPRFDVKLTVDPKQVQAWYEQHAPLMLPAPAKRGDASGGQLARHWWQFAQWKPPGGPPPPQDTPAVSHLAFTHLFSDTRLDMIVCDMRHGVVMAANPMGAPGNFLLLAQLKSPSRAEVVDLDRDGRRDLVVGELGHERPTDALIGRLTWLRAAGGESFEPITLLENIPRVADVRAGDLDGDGDTDLAVAVFGWMKVGHVMWMQNITPATPKSALSDPAQITFQPHILDPRPGALTVPLLDFDHDGDLDILALISQHHEQVMLYRRDADGFTPVMLHQAPHANWGYTSMEPVDIDADGDTDLLLTNGDTLDDYVPKPYHGVSLLENRGAEGMVHRRLTPLYGAHRALAADYDSDGDLDVMAVANLPHHLFQTQYAPDRVEGALFLERIGPTQFRRHVIIPDRPDFATMAVGDVDGDGRVEFALGALSYDIDVRLWPLPFWAMIARARPGGPLD